MLKALTGFQFVSFLLAMVFAGMVNAETGKAPDPKSVAIGKKLYEKYCQACHQKDGVGEERIPMEIGNSRFFTAMPLNETSHAWHHSDEQLVETILNGLQRTKRMPAFKNVISEQQAYHIVDYVKSLWRPEIIVCQGPKHMRCMQ